MTIGYYPQAAGDLGEADPRWVATVRSGALIVVWTSVALGLAFLGFVGLLLFTVLPRQRAGGLSWVAGHQAAVLITMTAVIVVASAVAAWGVWRLAAPDPSGVGEPECGRPRRLARAAAVVAAVAGFVVVGLAFAVGPSPTVLAAIYAVNVVCNLAIFVCLVATSVYLAHLVRRLPDARLSRTFGVVAWGAGVSLGLVQALEFAGLAMVRSAGRVGGTPVGAVVRGGTLLGGVAAIGFAVTFLVLLGLTARRLRRVGRPCPAAVPSA